MKLLYILIGAKVNKLSNRRTEDLKSKAHNNRNSVTDKISALIDNNDIRKIDTSEVAEWEYARRTNNELGDIAELSKSIINNGQLQPGLVVPKSAIFNPKTDNSNIKYIVIAGRRRYLACKHANIKYTAAVHLELTLEKALEVQRIENKEREDLSDFSEGMSYYEAVQNGATSLDKILKASTESRSAVYRYMSFGKIKDTYPELYNAIGDFSSISYRSAEELFASSKSGHVETFIHHAKEIRKGVGRRKLNSLISENTPSLKTWKHNEIKAFDELSGHKIKLYPDNYKIPEHEIYQIIFNALSKNLK
jgi:ParB family chromosome partitioning protein